MSEPNPKPSSNFEREARTEQPGLVREVIDLLAHNKKWWLGPILVVLLLVGVLIVLSASGSALAPFVYTLF